MRAAGLNYGDPDSGNYLFMDNGRLGLLDFGCLVDDHAQAKRSSVYHSVYSSDRSAPDLRRAFIELGLNPEDLNDESWFAVIDESVRWSRERLKRMVHSITAPRLICSAEPNGSPAPRAMVTVFPMTRVSFNSAAPLSAWLRYSISSGLRSI